MSVKYRYGHRPGKRRRTRVLIVMAVSLLILLTIGGIVGYDLYRNRSKPQEGSTLTIAQTYDDNFQKLTINEPTFTMELPSDWKEINRKISVFEHHITWQATKKDGNQRYLTVYVDLIPTTKSINILMPVSAVGNGISAGSVSDNCVNFTQGGGLTAQQALNSKETVAKWKQVDFICDLPRVFDQEVGTGSTDGINTVFVSGPKAGRHKYFFLYTDHQIQADYTFLYNAIESFKAK